MASYYSSSRKIIFTIFYFLCIALLLFSSWVKFAEADACPKVSTTWSGPCELEGCMRQCIVAESALFGACDHSQTTCFCFFQC
ncbi:hypothetical protein HN51_016970 [Arachis hypogaea]